MKILVVDDSITMRKIIIKALKKMGYEDIVEAANGREALEMADYKSRLEELLSSSEKNPVSQE